MKKLFILSLPIVLWACNSEPVGNPDGTGSFGAAITAEGAQPVARLDSLIGTNKEIANVKLEGKITDVCKKAGCWLSVEKDGKNMMVFCGNESYKVPKNSVGKTAIFEGKAYKDTLSPDMLRHLAMDGGMSEADAKAKFTQPEPTMSVEAKESSLSKALICPYMVKTVEAFIANRTGKQYEILLFLHDLLCNYPHISHKIHYKVPFYKRKKWLCYLNPTKQGGVEMCFIRGYQMANEQGLLQAKGRKQIAGVTFFDVTEIPVAEVKELIQEAILLEDL